MKALIVCALAAIAGGSLQESVEAQWASHPGKVPRNADGTPNVEAPAPRTADGKPDLTGVWQGANATGGGPAAAAMTYSEGPPVAGFLNVGQNLKDGLPLTAAGTALLEARRAANGKDNPEAVCLPMGIVQFHTQGAPRKFIQTPDVLVILYEASMGLRQVFTDGRALPTDDPQPWWYGYSVGRWDGDTLIVETNGLREDGWLDVFGSPLTETAKVTERIRRPTYGRMEIDITIDDPKVYTRPWTVRVNQRIMPEQELLEFVCLENQRYNVRD